MTAATPNTSGVEENTLKLLKGNVSSYKFGLLRMFIIFFLDVKLPQHFGAGQPLSIGSLDAFAQVQNTRGREDLSSFMERRNGMDASP